MDKKYVCKLSELSDNLGNFNSGRVVWIVRQFTVDGKIGAKNVSCTPKEQSYTKRRDLAQGLHNTIIKIN